MRALIMRDKELRVGEFPTCAPGQGEVLIKVNACGICGSDIHALKHGEEFVRQSKQGGALGLDMDTRRDVVMGHEFCGEILEYGNDCARNISLGTNVCSIPALLRNNVIQTLGYSNEHPGGYAEYMCLTESFLEPVRNGLSPTLAALTEPMAVGLHAVNKARLETNDVPLVIGCGPVGLAVIAELRLKNIHPIVAADFSPTRRKLAEAMGADVVVDPNEKSPYESWQEVAALSQDNDRNRPGWIGQKFRPAVVFECVGTPGVINSIMENVQHGARIIVVGVCMEHDHFHPVYGINKELNLQFVVAYNRKEFAQAHRHISDGELLVEPLITGQVSLDDSINAFEELASPDKHAKIIVHPHFKD